MTINSSDDSNLVIDRVKTSSSDMKAIEVEQEIAENANKEPLDVDMETGEILEADFHEVEDDEDYYGNMSDDDIQAMLDAEAELGEYEF